MNGRRTATATVVAVVVLLLPIAVAGPTTVPARPASEILVQPVAADDRSQRSTSEAWDTVPSMNVPLTGVPGDIPSASDTSIESVCVQSTRTDERLYLRLSWADGTASRNAISPRSLFNAVAVQVPVNISVRLLIPIRSTRSLVNVRYWSADGEAEELLAGDPGSMTEFERTAAETTASHDDGRWTAVMSYPSDSDAANRTSFAVDNNMDMAFAVWNGSEMEHSDRESVSKWYHFPLGSRPQGPPYELVLRTAAGLAIIGIALVTIEAVRKNWEHDDGHEHQCEDTN